MMRPFKELDDVWNEMKDSGNMHTSGPYYYGYSVTIGPDGKPVVKEYGNVRENLLPTAETRETFLDAERGERKYHTKIPIKQKVDENSVKATYANGILEVRFKLKEEERPKGKKVEVE